MFSRIAGRQAIGHRPCGLQCLACNDGLYHNLERGSRSGRRAKGTCLANTASNRGGTVASIRKRGELQWEARVRRRGQPVQCKTFTTKAHAEVWVRQVEGEMDRGVFVSRAEAENTTLAEALTRYAQEITPTKKPSTAKRERDRIKNLTELTLARRPLAAIRGADVAAFIRTRQSEGLGSNAIRLDLALLSHLFNTARTAWGMESLSNPVDLVKGQRPKLPAGRDRRLVGDEETRLLAAARAYDQVAPPGAGNTEALITWAIETAMRRGEMAAMRWEHLDRTTRTLLIPDTKTGVSRTIPLSPAALKAVDRPFGLQRELSPKTRGLVWNRSPDAISRAFMEICKAAGIRGLTFHDLRHEATSRLFEKHGFSALEAAAVTGHKTMQMLKRYTHLRAEDLAKRMR